MDSLSSEEGLSGDDKILHKAKRRFKQCQNFEGQTRNFQLEDIKFANGDSDNLYQWPDSIRRNREVDQRPCLTNNKVRQHNLQIINDIRQNKPGIKYRPVGDGATYDASQIYEGLARHTEYISNAQDAYINAVKFQVQGGIGYVRVVTDYAGDDSFDQEIFIRPINDPMTVYIDPDIKEFDGSDAEFGFIFDSMPREEFNILYPKYKDIGGQSVLGETGGWIDKDHVRRAEYYTRTRKKDRLVAFTNPQTGEQIIERVSKLHPDLVNAVTDDPQTKFRTIYDDVVEYYLIFGDKIVERNIWPGKYIPIVRFVGEETIIDGVLDRKGHTRAMKDPQRMYNYWTSNGVEFIALQSKSPYIVPVQAIKGYETYWSSANNVNHAYLPYNHLDNKGNIVPVPQRQEPPVMAPAYIEGMKVAQQEMMMTSGQYEATFGQKSNETSGRAINERQLQGDVATVHFKDNVATAIRYIGKICLDLYPKIYDTPRVIRIMGEDKEEKHVQLDPKAQVAYQEQQAQQKEDVSVIFNPNVGRYDVQSDSGPAYATKRMEAFNALSQIMQQNPETARLVGDLWADNSDFPTADKIAERFRNMLPPQATGAAPPEAIQQMQEEMGQLQAQYQKTQQMNEKLIAQLTEEKLKARDNAAKTDIDQYKAQTDRMSVMDERMTKIADILEKHIVTPRLQAEMLHDLAVQEHAGEVAETAARTNAELAPKPTKKEE